METAKLLFTPGYIGKMELKNRVVMAPMVRNYADDQGRMTPRYLAHLERIAKGGVAAMILEATFVSPEGRGFRHSWDCILTPSSPGSMRPRPPCMRMAPGSASSSSMPGDRPPRQCVVNSR